MGNTIPSMQILRSLSDATADLVSKVSPSVVSIRSGMGGGTGVVIDSDGHILTASHVVHRVRSVKVGLGDGKMVDAEIIGRDPYSDIALLKMKGDGLKPIECGDSERINVGEFVLALANPFNRKPSATSGIVTSTRSTLRGMRGMNMENVIITDARLNPGYSGGPLIDASGRMIGMNTAYAMSRGIAIPVNTVKAVVERLMKGGEVKRAYLGVFMNTISIPQEVAEATGIDQEAGVVVLRVEPDSPAKKAGITFGDVIVRFNQKPVRDVSDLPNLLTEELVGNITKVVVLRGEKVLEFTITPGSARAEDSE